MAALFAATARRHRRRASSGNHRLWPSRDKRDPADRGSSRTSHPRGPITAMRRIAIKMFLAGMSIVLDALAADAQMTAMEIVDRMVEMSARRNEALRSYSNLRTYTVEYNGIKH